MKRFKKIPKFVLDEKSILDNCEWHYVVMESEIPHMGFIGAPDEVLIITRNNGYLRIKIEDFEKLTEELGGMKELIKLRRTNK